MKPHTIIIFLFISLFVVSVSPTPVSSQQRTHNIEWSKCYGGSRDENGSGVPFSKTILPTSDGGYLIAAETSSINGDIDKNRRFDDFFKIDSFTNEDIWLTKLSKNGSIEWDKYYGGEGADYVTYMSVTSDGGYILCGTTGSISGDFPFDTTGVIDVFLNGGTNDGYVMKLDSLGRKEWITRIGGSDEDGLSSVIQAKDDGYIAVGWSYSTDEIWGGLSWIGHKGFWADALVVKLNANGEKLWSELFGGTGNEYFYRLVEANNGYILCGGTNSDDGDISKLHYRDSLLSLGNTDDVWIVQIDKNAKILWEKCYGGSGSDGGVNILPVKNDNYVIVANTSSLNGDVVGYHPEKNGLSYFLGDAWIFQIDTLKNIVWQNCIGGSQQDIISTLIESNSGGYSYIGFTNSSDSNLNGIHKPENNWDIWVGEVSSTGKLLWHECYGGTANDYGNGIVVNSADEFTIYGSISSIDGDIVGSHGGDAVHNRDIWIAKLQKKQNAVEASTSTSNFANPFPNPAYNQMSVYIHPTQPVERVQFFSPLGQEFYPSYRIEGNLLTADLNTLSSGIYFIRITYKDLSVQEVRKFVKVD